MLKIIGINAGYSYPTPSREASINLLPKLTATVLDTNEGITKCVELGQGILSLESVSVENVCRTIVSAMHPNALFSEIVVWPDNCQPDAMMRSAYDDLKTMLALYDEYSDIIDEYSAADLRDMIEYCDQYK